jgi:hypothetical protein
MYDRGYSYSNISADVLITINPSRCYRLFSDIGYTIPYSYTDLYTYIIIQYIFFNLSVSHISMIGSSADNESIIHSEPYELLYIFVY